MLYISTYADEEEFKKAEKEGAMAINDIPIESTTKSASDIIDKITTTYEGETIQSLPSCHCGPKASFLKGTICSVCNNEIISNIDSLQTKPLWIRTPNGVTALLRPHTGLIFGKIFGTRSVCMLSFFLLSDYVPNKGKDASGSKLLKNIKYQKLLKIVIEHNIERNLNYFMDNFIHIVKILIDKRMYGINDQLEAMDFLSKLKSGIITHIQHFIPLPNSRKIVIEKNNKTNYIEESVIEYIQLCTAFFGIDVKKGNSLKSVMRLTSQILIKLTVYSEKYTKTKIFKKPGIIRKHITSTRNHFTGRAVITQINGESNYNELHIPWVMSNELFRPYILRILQDKGMDLMRAIIFLSEYMDTYNPLLEEIHSEVLGLVEGGIPTLFQRNPLLLIGSQLRCNITKIKKDVMDKTIGINILLAPPMNADFDGDALNLLLMQDKKTAKYLELLDLSRSFHGLSYRETSGLLNLPAPIVINIQNEIEADRKSHT